MPRRVARRSINMKVCHMEAMKEIKALEEEKSHLLEQEDDRCTVSYKENEQKVDTGYCYEKIRGRIRELDARIRKIKSTLAYANCTVMLEGFDITIGEGLVLLAQLNAEYSRLCYMARYQQLTRRITPVGVIEYTECLFDTEAVGNEAKALKARISSLQVAIDRANLLSTVEI